MPDGIHDDNAYQIMPVPFVLKLKATARRLRRLAGFSPMQKALSSIEAWGFRIQDAEALECFAFTGDMHTIDYGRKVRSLSLWEINAAHERRLRHTFPEAEIRITDTYEQVLRESRRFDLVVIDNTPAQTGHTDAFDLFPGIFRILKDRAILILTIIPELNGQLLRMYPGAGLDDARRARSTFYRIADPMRVTPPHMVAAYGERASEAGFEIQHFDFKRRNSMSMYLVFDLIRKGSSHGSGRVN